MSPSDESAEEGHNQTDATNNHPTREAEQHSERHIEQRIKEEPPPTYLTTSAPPEPLSPVQVAIGPANASDLENAEPKSRRTMYYSSPLQVLGAGPRHQSGLTPLDDENGIIDEGISVPPRVDSAHRVASSLQEAAQCSTCGDSSASKSYKGPSNGEGASRNSSGISRASHEELFNHPTIANNELTKENKEFEQAKGSSKAKYTRIQLENGELKDVYSPKATEPLGEQMESNSDIEVIDGPRKPFEFTGQIGAQALQSKCINLSTHEEDEKEVKRDSTC